MKNKEKIYSIALVSTFIILFLIIISSTASASVGKDPRTIALPEITIGAGDPSDDRTVLDGILKDRNGIFTAAPVIIETQITNDTRTQWFPVIYGNRIVWMDDRNGNWDIYMYNLSTRKETQITTSSSNQDKPDIYSDRIVWTDFSSGEGYVDSDIYMFNLSTQQETQITTNESAQYSPAVNGNRIVWADWRNDNGSLTNGDIYMYDLSTQQETQITTKESDQYSPQIYGNRIVWVDWRNDNGSLTNSDIYMYDLSTSEEIQITTNESTQYSPAIYSSRIVWEDYRNGNADIYMYNLSTKEEIQITANPSNSLYPSIYGNRIAWMDDRNRNWDIYVYDLTTGQESHTTNGLAQGWPDIYGDRIVWEDYRKENEIPDIYTGILSSKPPVAAFLAAPTSGKAPLNVAFTDKSSGAPSKWEWSFGDGTNSTEQNPIHKYRAEGNYTVKLTASNDLGSNTTTKTNYIKATPTNTRPGIYSKN